MAQQCLDRDITINTFNGKVTVSFAGKQIAETTSALELKEGDYPVVYYIPRRAVQAEVLVASKHATTCPFKGEASYHHLKSGEETAENAVWYYPNPCPLVDPIRDHVAFWGDAIRLHVEPN